MTVFNAKPFFLFENVFSQGTLTATDTDSDDTFDVDNLINQVIFQLWKAASLGTKYITVDLNKVLNAGFETGDFSNWTANSATIGTNPASGTKNALLQAVGANLNGATSDSITVDATKIYQHRSQLAVGGWVSGTYRLLLLYLDSGGNEISQSILESFGADTGGYQAVSKSIGPAGSGKDFEFPAGTVAVQFRQNWSGGTPEGNGRLDDVLLYQEFDPDTIGIANHNLWGANATVSVESTDSDKEIIGALGWVEQLAGFTPSSSRLILKEFTAVGSAERAWRVKIVTANLAPFMGDVKLGAKMEFPRWVQGPFGPRPRKVEGEVAANDAGQFIQRTVIRKEAEVTLQFNKLTKSFVWDTLAPAFDNYLISGSFYFTWDIDQHEDQKMICYLPDGAELNPQYEGRRLTVSLRVMPMPEG